MNTELITIGFYLIFMAKFFVVIGTGLKNRE